MNIDPYRRIARQVQRPAEDLVRHIGLGQRPPAIGGRGEVVEQSCERLRPTQGTAGADPCDLVGKGVWLLFGHTDNSI